MAKKLKKCIISRYDPTITEPPFLTIPLDEVEVHKPDNDDGGVRFASKLIQACNSKGYMFKFYSGSDDPDIDYEIVVY